MARHLLASGLDPLTAVVNLAPTRIAVPDCVNSSLYKNIVSFGLELSKVLDRSFNCSNVNPNIFKKVVFFNSLSCVVIKSYW